MINDEEIQKKVEQFYLRQVELEKTQQQRVKSYEEQKTISLVSPLFHQT